MKALLASIVALTFGAVVVSSCKKESSATFSQGNKKVVRKTDSIDRSKAADIAATLAPANAITRGSFTVWTEPRDPQPGQSYQIFIEVRLPASLSTYAQTDLSGTIVGSDGYEQSISDDNSGCNIDADLPSDKAETTDKSLGLKGHPSKKALNLAGCNSSFAEFVFNPGRGRLSVWVPGGGDKVHDTINVASAVLNERQSIAIEF